jgi:transposase-like protein
MPDQNSTTIVSVNDNTSPPADPSANALRHGLTAAKFLPNVLQPGRLEEIVVALHDEYQPRTITETLLLREIARHAAALELTEEAEPAVWRISAQALAPFAAPDAAPDVDVQLVAAVTAENTDRVARYRRGHEKGLHQAIDKFRSLQAATSRQSRNSAMDSATRFATEDDCESYLRAKFSLDGWRCSRCRGSRGSWLAKRKVWQCTKCEAQFGLRHGTVFARSALPLTKWFAAIRTFAANTSITAADLMTATGITRLATAQSMLRRIHRAVDEDNIQRGLAGLTAYAVTCES